MPAWTKETALAELDGLVAEISALKEGRPHDAAHMLWLTKALEFLTEVFGTESRYFKIFAHLRWQETGTIVFGGAWDMEDAVEAAHLKAYRRSLETAVGALEGARHLVSRADDIRSVYRGKLDEQADQSLDEARAAGPSGSGVTMAPAITNYGVLNMAGTGAGDIFQSTPVQFDRPEVLKLLDQLTQTLADLQVSEDEKEAYLKPVRQLGDELRKPNALIATLRMAWAAIKAIGVTESGIQGGERIVAIRDALANHLDPALHIPPNLMA